MNEHTTLEKIAPNVEEAIAQGLAELGLDKAAVDVEVLDEGSRGLAGHWRAAGACPPDRQAGPDRTRSWHALKNRKPPGHAAASANRRRRSHRSRFQCTG